MLSAVPKDVLIPRHEVLSLTDGVLTPTYMSFLSDYASVPSVYIIYKESRELGNDCIYFPLSRCFVCRKL